MGKGYIGESKADRAINKMIKFMEKSDRQNANAQIDSKDENAIVAQLKAIYPESWREELREIQLEAKYPEYLGAKRKAREQAREEFAGLSRVEREKIGLGESQYISRYIARWKTVNTPKL